MKDLICHIAPLGMNTDWIKEGLLYFDWNYLLIITTFQKEYVDLAKKLEEELRPSFKISDKRPLESKIKKEIDILIIEGRNILNFLKIIKKRIIQIRDLGYKIYFNATSGLELWKFAAYFLSATENLIDKFYYIPKDSDLNEPIKPLEIYTPIPLSKPLKKILYILYEKKISQSGLVKSTGYSKGLISRYLKQLKELGLIEISKKKKGKERFFEITDKGNWFI